MTSILVTGEAGYIGSHTSAALAAAGYPPVVLDNLSASHRRAVRWGATVSHRAAPVIEYRRGSRDPPALIADPQPARSLLRWTPLKPDLHKVVRTAWQWCRTRVFEPTEKQKLKSTLV
jgi:UDP-glucose 4-epimerase